MQGVTKFRDLGLLLVALALAASGVASAISYVAPGPGSDLAPLAGAERVVRLVQGQQTVLWTSLTGPVRAYQALGWPSSDGIHELGGALVIEKVDTDAGVISFGEKPMSLEFTFSG